MDIQQAGQIAKALADPYRLEIISKANTGGNHPLSFAGITALFNLSAPAVFHHVKQLTEAGLLVPLKKGRSNYYTVDRNVLDNYMNFLRQALQMDLAELFAEDKV